jgi:hypothetical protein
MKTLLRALLAAALLAGVGIAPAFAQNVIGTLHVNGGTVMTSSGEEFTTAGDNQPLQSGDRIMVSEGGSASITYSNGVVVNYTEPGVYTVQLPAGGTEVAGAGGSKAGSVGIILGAALLGAAAIESMGDDVPPDQPISR